MKTRNRIPPSVYSHPSLNRWEWARANPLETGAVNEFQVRKLSVASLARFELSLADLEAERLFVRNHRGEYYHSGVTDFQFTELDDA